MYVLSVFRRRCFPTLVAVTGEGGGAIRYVTKYFDPITCLIFMYLASITALTRVTDAIRTPNR